MFCHPHYNVQRTFNLVFFDFQFVLNKFDKGQALVGKKWPKTLEWIYSTYQLNKQSIIPILI